MYALEMSDYKLTDLLSAAGATIGIIIGGTIFLQFMSGKYMDLMTRYRSLTGEYRKCQKEESRHGLLRDQIRNYRFRLRLMNWASCLAGPALFCFLISVLAGGVSMIFPLPMLKWIGTITLLIGLLLITGGVVMQIIESISARHEIDCETGDLDEPAKGI